MERNDARFWAKVDKNGPLIIEDECWVWTGYIRTGYGMFRVGPNTTTSASRVSYQMHYGVKLDRHTLVRHRCDNRPCVRPTHLLAGTYQDNSNDAMERERLSHTAFTHDMVVEARNRARAGESLHDIIKDMPPGTAIETLAAAVRGKTYPYAEAEPVPDPSFLKKKYQKLSDEEYLEIFEALKNPWRGQGNFLARKYGVDKSLISLIKNGKFYPASLAA